MKNMLMICICIFVSCCSHAEKGNNNVQTTNVRTKNIGVKNLIGVEVLIGDEKLPVGGLVAGIEATNLMVPINSTGIDRKEVVTVKYVLEQDRNMEKTIEVNITIPKNIPEELRININSDKSPPVEIVWSAKL